MKRKVYRFYYINNPNCYVAIKASYKFIAKLKFLLRYK